MTDLERQLLESVLDVVNQACQVEYRGGKDHTDGVCIVSPMGTSAYEDAIHFLELIGHAKYAGNNRWELVWPDKGR